MVTSKISEKARAANWKKRGPKTLRIEPSPVSGKRIGSVQVPDVGFMDLEAVLKVFPVGKDYWQEGVRSRKYPAPVKIAPRTYAWRSSDIKKLLQRIGDDADLHTMKSLKRDDKLTFEVLARQWLAKRESEVAARTCAQQLRWLERQVFPYIGKLPPRRVTTNHVMQVIQRTGKQVSFNSSVEVRQMLSMIFRFGVMSDLCDRDPAQFVRVKEMFAVPDVKHHASIKPNEIPELLATLARNDARLLPTTRLALRLMMHAFVRTKELRLAEWGEIDFRNRQWLIPGHRMKMGKDHIVPLSRQAMAILRELKLRADGGKYVFPGMLFKNARQPMHENVLKVALLRMGYGGRMTVHGFRSLAMTTLLEKHKVRFEFVDMQLAHAPPNRYRQAYNRALYLPERTKMMQMWSNFLDDQERKGLARLPFGSAPRSNESFREFRGLNITTGMKGKRPIAFAE